MRRYLKIAGLLLFAGLVFGQEVMTLTLEQCVEIALKQNPQLAQSRLNRDMAGKDVMIAVANFLPSASFGVGYNHSVNGPTETLWIDPNTGLTKDVSPEVVSWYSSAGFRASQTLFNGGYNYFNMKNSLAGKRSAQYNFEDTKQQIIYIVKQRVYDLLKSEKLLEVSQEALKSSEESFKLAEAKYQVGTAPKSEMLQFKVELENARLAQIESEHNLSIAQTSLNQVLGMDMDQKIEVVDDMELPEVQIGIEDAIGISAEKHPLLLKSSADLDGSRAYIGMAVSSYLPSVTASYSYGWFNSDFGQIKHMFDTNYNWSAGVSLSIPIFQGFSRFAQLGKARLNYKMNQEILNYYRRQVNLEVKQAYYSVQLAKSKIGVSEDAERAAEETLRLNKEKYNLGAGTYLDLINAQSSHTEAQSNRIQALYDYKFAVAMLKRAMGRLTE
jgi:outer membrane protein